LYKNKDEIQIVSPKLYEGKYFKHYHGGDKRTVKYGIGYLVCAGFKPAMIDLMNG
jgi:hypothetical protein